MKKQEKCASKITKSKSESDDPPQPKNEEGTQPWWKDPSKRPEILAKRKERKQFKKKKFREEKLKKQGEARTKYRAERRAKAILRASTASNSNESSAVEEPKELKGRQKTMTVKIEQNPKPINRVNKIIKYERSEERRVGKECRN